MYVWIVDFDLRIDGEVFGGDVVRIVDFDGDDVGFVVFVVDWNLFEVEDEVCDVFDDVGE